MNHNYELGAIKSIENGDWELTHELVEIPKKAKSCNMVCSDYLSDRMVFIKFSNKVVENASNKDDLKFDDGIEFKVNIENETRIDFDGEYITFKKEL